MGGAPVIDTGRCAQVELAARRCTPVTPNPWSYVNARRAKERHEAEVAALKARIERLEGQVRDLGGEPEP